MRRISERAAVGLTAAWLAVAVLVSGPASAGMVCRSISIAGFDAPAHTAGLVLASASGDPERLEVFVARTPIGFYYQSNFVAAGTAYPAKIYSAEPMPLRELVENLLYTSRAEAAAHLAVTNAVIARRLTIYLDGEDPAAVGLDATTVVHRKPFPTLQTAMALPQDRQAAGSGAPIAVAGVADDLH